MISIVILILGVTAQSLFVKAAPAGEAAPQCDASANQTSSPCGKCEYMTCKYRHPMEPRPPPCDECAGERRTPDCRCKDGFVWHEGRCINHDDCPKPCGKFQAFYYEGRMGNDIPDWKCHPSCSDPFGHNAERNKDCFRTIDSPICYCIHGYLRNDNGDCIKEEECPKTTTDGPKTQSTTT